MREQMISKLMIASFLVAVGCSVKGGLVDKHSPVIEPKVMQYGVSYGQLKPDSASVLMYPTDWSEKEAEEKVEIINNASKLITANSARVWSTKETRGDLWDEFRKTKCISQFRDPEQKTCSDPDLPDDDQPIECGDEDVIVWKAIDATSDTADFAACRLNQDQRIALKAAIDDLGKATFEAKQTIDEVAGPNTSVAILASGSSITLNDVTKNPGVAPVIVVLAGFNGIKACKDKTPCVQTSESTDENGEALPDDPTRIRDVSIDANGRRLKFTVPDLQSWDNHTKKYLVEYQFDLSRTSNGSEVGQKNKVGGLTVPRRDFAVFKGDVLKLINGKVDAKGSGQIFGEFAAPAAVE